VRFLEAELKVRHSRAGGDDEPNDPRSSVRGREKSQISEDRGSGDV
jgi:hypothetical protein